MTKFDDTIMAGENLREAEISMGRMDANSELSNREKHCYIPKLKRLQINDQYLAFDELFKTLNSNNALFFQHMVLRSEHSAFIEVKAPELLLKICINFRPT